MDRCKDRYSLKCTTPYNLSPQRDMSQTPCSHRCTSETCNIRRICLAVFFLIGQSFKLQPLHSGNHATVIVFTFNPLFYANGPTEMRTIHGTKLIVISARSFGTLGILERSGISAKCRNNSDRPEHWSQCLDAALRSGLLPPGFACPVFHTDVP